MCAAAADPLQTPDRADLIACPQCDAVWQLRRPEPGEKAICQRCHTALITPRAKAGKQIIALALAVVTLVVAASVFPFLTIRAAGNVNSVSVVDAALAFQGGPLIFLAFATLALIVLIPLLRAVLLLYVLIPLVQDRPPARFAMPAFRMSETLRPWSMAEIFAIGVAVALVKITDLALVSFGPAFWMFAVLVVLVVAKDNLMCRWSIWNALEHPKRR